MYMVCNQIKDNHDTKRWTNAARVVSCARTNFVHSAGWVREHADRWEVLERMGVSLVSNACICKACNTAILRGTRLLMDDKLPQQYKPRWCKRVASSKCCIPVDARVMNHPYTCLCLFVWPLYATDLAYETLLAISGLLRWPQLKIDR